MARRHHAVDCETYANWDETADETVDVDCHECGQTNEVRRAIAGQINRTLCECGAIVEHVG